MCRYCDVKVKEGMPSDELLKTHAAGLKLEEAFKELEIALLAYKDNAVSFCDIKAIDHMRKNVIGRRKSFNKKFFGKFLLTDISQHRDTITNYEEYVELVRPLTATFTDNNDGSIIKHFETFIKIIDKVKDTSQTEHNDEGDW